MTTSRTVALCTLALIAAASGSAFASGSVVVTPDHLKPDPKTGIIRVDLPPYTDADPNHTRAPVVGLKDIETLMLNWFRRGNAAGHHGDLYDNRDRDHSNLRPERFPQLTFVEYDDALKKRGVDYTVNPGLLFNRVTFGNSSTASKGPLWRSNARRCYTEPRAAAATLRQYLGNHLYVYPEHRDHDPGHNGHGGGYGDLFATNTPYILVSQGSSGSDRVFLEAIASVLAAYRPHVKAHLIERRLVAPVTQAVLRRTYADVRSDDDYLTGAAHPTVFDGKKLDRRAAVERANALTVEDIPPLARLTVVAESLGKPGVDYFERGPMERLMHSPFVIARVHRAARRTYTMVIDARPYPPAADDAAAPPDVRFRWSLLRGDPQRVRIKPVDATGSRVRIEVDYHERMPVAPGSPMFSNRVDIGCFADNGKMLSAPSFVTVATLDSERRKYDANGRIVEIQYGAATSRVEVNDWPKLLRWIADHAAGDTRRLTASLTDAEHAAVVDAARDCLKRAAEAADHPPGPTRTRLTRNADAALDRDRPLLGGSLRSVVARLDADALQRLVPDGTVKVQRSANYADPLIATRCYWRDVYEYAPGIAEPIGWTRHRAEGEPERFTAQGWRVTAVDDHGRPLAAVAVSYARTGRPPNAKIVQSDTETVHRFEYDDDAQRVGRVVSPSPPESPESPE